MVNALETSDLGRRYMLHWGLRNCTLQIPEGSITGLVGPNGAGKSTLLRLCAGMSRPSAGSLSVFGQTVNPNSASFLAKVGYLDQLRPLYKQLRVDETLKFAQKMNPSWDQSSAVRWLEELNIPFDWKVGLLSVGQQAQIALAVCMGKRPNLMLLDEPFASLDPLARRGVTQIILDSVAERQSTVFLSSHIVSELEPICDYLIVLSKSEVQLAGTTESILANHHVLVGPAESASFDSAHVISSVTTGRQTTLLIEGEHGRVDDSWQVLAPDLEEIFLGYLANPNFRQTKSSAGGLQVNEEDRS
jgi:ABC-2 type transport system ATP-binding protein